MRKLLLAGVALLALAGPANAQGIPVYDNAIFLSQLKQLAEWAKTAASWAHQAAQMEANIAQLYQTYQAITHITDISGALNVLGGVSTTYLPPGNDIGPMLTGAGQLWGTAANFAHANTLYDMSTGITAGTQQAELMAKRIAGTSNAQALADAANQSDQLHVAGLTLLQDLVSVAPANELPALQAAIDLYKQNATVQHQQIDNARLMLEAQQAAYLQQVEQINAKDANALFEQFAAVPGSIQ